MSICPKNKSSKARRDKRRANWKMSAPNLVKCSKCGELMMPHRVCKACGSYNKREAINVDVLNRFEDGAEVTAESLLASGAISKIADGVKILGNGELTKKLNVKVNAVSETAKSKIEAAGGTVEVI